MNMLLNDYENITLSQFFNKVEGFFKHLREMQEAEWTRTNYMVYSLLSMHPYIKENQKPKSFDDFVNRQVKANEKASKLIEKL